MVQGLSVARVAIVVLAVLVAEAHAEQSFVERNVNAQGVTPPGEYQGIRNMQDNEPSCAINPLLARNFICTWNSSAGSDDEIGDTWIRKSESIDGGASFINQFINGAPNDPNNSLGLSFAADPVTMCWPGGCGTVFLAANRAPGVFPSGGGIFLQTSVDMNRDVGFRHALSGSVDTVYSSGPGEFADKPFATYILDEENPGTVEVTYEVESPDGGFEIVTREWPRGRIVVAFAVGNPDTDEIKLVSTFTEDYGKTWSIPLELTSRGYWIDSVRVPNKCKKNPGNDECKELLPQGLNQGINMSVIGNDLLYTFRVFEDSENPSAIRGIHSPDKGESVGEAFDIVSPFCAYDVPTLPNASNTTTAASRTNAFPWISNNGLKHLLVYSERKLSSDGGCFTTFDTPTDSRIKALTLSPDGSSQSAAIEVAPNPGHGFQFQPVVDCSLGSCQVAFWDSRFDSQRVINYLTNVSTSPMRLEALEAFLNFPVLGDFNYLTGPTTVIQFRRTARVVATKMDVSGPLPVALDSPPVVVSKYRRALVDGVVREIERDGFNIKAFRDNFVPFMGDYSWLTSQNLRLVFDSSEPGSEPRWESNRSVDPQNLFKIPQYFIAFVTSRNVKGDIYTARIGDQTPYTRTPGTTTASVPRNDDPRTGENPDDARIMHADAVEDSNPGAGFCAPTGNPGPGVIFDAINNLTKDFDIYGATIEGRASAFTLNPTKTYNIQRASTVVVENESDAPKSFRLLIDNQPTGAPEQARASWKQLPFDPALPEFATTPPDIEEFIDVAEFSSESLAVFVVSQQLINPVAIKIFEQLEGGGEVLINTLIVNGVAEDGQFINEDGTLNDFEIHNPFVYYPTVFNPDEYNPDEYNPDEFNPDVYTPDEFNPDEFNPDEFNPDEFNPDEFNPDEFNPDEFNPDEFNPDEFNPDEFNSPLLDPGNLENPDIPPPTPTVTGGDIARLDINFGLENTGNTTTPYVIDMKYENEEVQDLFTAGLLSATIVGWQDGKFEDSQFCAPREVSVNSILVVDREPDLTTLLIPDINNNRAGEITVWAAPDDVIQILLRITGPRDLLVEYREELSWVNLSTVFSSQVANTGATELITDETILLDNRKPPDFVNFLPVDSTTFEAEGPNGVLVPADFIQAERDSDPVTVVCDPALPAQVGLDIFNTPPGPTIFSCTATTDNGVSASLSLDVFVLDTKPPTIDPTSVPADITIEVDPAGTVVNFATPTATDFNGVDPDVDVTCSPASGSVFPFTSPSLTTPVTCTATDDSMLTDTASFNVTVQDTSAPQFNNFDPPEFEPPLIDKFVLDDDKSTFQLFWGPFEVTDADQMPTVTCNVGVLDPSRSDPSLGLYTFVHEFPVGLTNVSCTATDVLGNSTTASFPVEIFDETAPTITLLGDPEITIEQGDTYVD
ncbi:MAG: HYR domain-containing protein, partial [Woeseiaceae bacterium]|nr:HYR domain-containing protein [Woeseiaceae bacterium]